ncbi:ras-related protein Rab-21-like [Pollicipes pollicipes]|uniref:ras-related protein Rab-21-like n=1 Tax=Pollicipes pollicipes TaxID=41117 RepID=UPI001884F9F1|nr:ras-related protein Rab-21-like [Pollicipes pollicipes]XP_037069872.1 ras-related protein Rab-21-like [Pollicipes pollicipes]XP_037069873.1 ras-related protein Rab-21-like [Pollicipes pollicipes]
MASPAGATARPNVYSFKVVLLGEGAVGKTSVVLSYVEGKFNEKHTTTLQASFLTKKLSLGGRRVSLAIWDTAGQERFHALGPIYYRDSNGACLVYDVTDEDSFQKVKNWVKELRKMLGSEICLVICGNKVDLAKERVVDLSTALAYADSVGAKHFETSAKTGVGIEEVFLFLSQQMVRVKDSKEGAVGTGSLRRRQNVVVVEQPEPEPAKRACCG